MHCGPPNQNFGWVIAHPTHRAASPMVSIKRNFRNVFDLSLNVNASSHCSTYCFCGFCGLRFAMCNNSESHFPPSQTGLNQVAAIPFSCSDCKCAHPSQFHNSYRHDNNYKDAQSQTASELPARCNYNYVERWNRSPIFCRPYTECNDVIYGLPIDFEI